MSNKKYKKLEFSTLEDELLIEKVKDNPPLYAKKLKSYKDMKMKDKIWAKIAKDFEHNRTGEECKKRWTNLRDYYRKIRRKLGTDGSVVSGQKHDKLEQLNFLENTALEHKKTICSVSVTTTIPNISTITSIQQTGDNSREEDNGEEIISEAEIDDEEIETQKISTLLLDREIEMQETSALDSEFDDVCIEHQAQNVATSSTASDTENHQHKTSKKRSRAQMLKDIQYDNGKTDRIKLLRAFPQRARPSTPIIAEDHIDLFFKSLAATARTLSPWHLADAKRKLFNVMADIEYNHIKERYALPSTASAINPSVHVECDSKSDVLSTR